MSNLVRSSLFLVKRPELVEIEYFNRKGSLKKIGLNRRDSRVMLHELDHFLGEQPKDKGEDHIVFSELEKANKLEEWKEEQSRLGLLP